MKNRIICEICKKDVLVIYPNQKTCSGECRKKRLMKITGRYAKDKNISSATVGAISELAVSTDLMKRGYSVFRSLSPSCFCDVIAIKGGTTLRVEIRTGYISGAGKLFFPHKTHGEIDLFGVYERNTDVCYYFDKNKKPTTV